MKKILLFLIFLKFSPTFGYLTTRQTSIAAKAIIDVVKQVFIRNDMKFDILTIGETSTNIKFLEDQILMKLEGNFMGVIKNIAKPDDVNYLWIRPAVIFTQFKFMTKILFKSDILTRFAADQRYLIFIEGLNDLKNLQDLLHNKAFNIKFNVTMKVAHFAYYLVNFKDEIKLITSEWFTEEKCNEHQVLNLNSYNLISRSWTHPLKIPDKYKNFHNCTIFSIAFDDTRFEMYRHGKFIGLTPDLMRAVGKSANFSVFFQPIDREPENGVFLIPNIYPMVAKNMNFN